MVAHRSSLVDELGQDSHDALLVDLLHGAGELVDEALVVAQIVTEQLLDAQQLAGVVAAGLGKGLELLAHGVVDLKSVAGVVDAADVVEPAGEDEAEALERTRHPNLLRNGGHDELGDLARCVQSDTGDLVHDGGVGKALHESLAVLVNVDAGDIGQQGLDFLLHHLPDKLSVDGVLHDLVDVLETSKLSGVSHGRVAGVEETELVLLKLLNVVHVVDNLDADQLERRAAVAEVVLNNPLHEGLSDDGPLVLDTKLLSQRLDVVGRGAGGDAVHHGVGEVPLLADPLCELRVAETGKGCEHVAGNGTVLLHVVAGQNGKGLQTSGMAPGQCGVEEAECADGRVFFGQIVLDVWMLGLELVSVLVVVVTALRDGEGNNVRVWVCHLGNYSFPVIGSKEEGVDAPNDIGKAALGGALNDRVQVVLGGQNVAHGGIVGSQTDTADGPILLVVVLKELVNVDSQVSSVEATDSYVDDALLDVTSVISRDLHSALALPRGDGG